MTTRAIKKHAILLSIVAGFIFISGCGMENSGGQMSYEDTKTMVLDLLKSEDGKKAVDEVIKSREAEMNNTELMYMLSSPEGQQIKAAVKEVITDPSFPKVMEQLMTDPKFAGEFAKAVQTEDKELHKKLMKDPEYQTLMLDIMKSEDYKKLVSEVLKDKEYRKQSMMIMQEALETPTFKLELMELLKKVMKEEESKNEEQGKGSEGGGEGKS